MALTVGELVGYLDLDKSRFDRGLSTAEGGFRGMAGKLGTLAAGAALGVGAAMAGAAVAGLKSFSDLQSGMNEVFTLLPGISKGAMGEMTGQVKDFSKEFGVLPNDVVPALYQSLSAGVPPDNVFAYLETAQKAAKGGVTDLTTAVDGISSVVNAYGDDVMDATKASDLMFTAVRLGKTDFGQLSASLSNVTPIASALGVGFEDVTAGLALMTSKGTQTSVATTQLRQLFVELSKAGGNTAKAFEEIAGKSFQQFIAEGGNVAGALDVMQEAADANGVKLQDMFGSVEAGAAALSLAGEDTAAYSDTIAEMAGSAGATEAAFDQMNQGIGVAFEKIRAQGAVLLVDLGEKLAPAFQAFADWLIANMPAITEVVGTAFRIIGEVAQALGAIIGPLMDGMSAALGGFGSKATEVGGTATGFFETVKTVFTQIRDTVTAMMEAAQERIGSIMASISDIFSGVLEAVTVLWNMFGDDILQFVKSTFNAIMRIIDGVLKVIKGIIDVFIGVLTGDWSRAWNGIKSILSGVWDIIMGVVSRAMATIQLVIGAALEVLRTLWDSTLGKVVTLIGEKVGEAVQWFSDLPGRITSALGNLGSLLMGAGRDLVQGFINGIKNMFGNVRSTLGDLTSKLTSWKGPAAVDRTLLRGPARLIMGGFAHDLDRYADRLVKPTLAGITGSMAGAAGAGLGGGQAPLSGRLRLVVGDREFDAYVDDRVGATFSGGTHRARLG